MRRSPFPRSLVVFLLVASFGILFVGCGKQEEGFEEFTLTTEELEKIYKLASSKASETGSGMTASSVSSTVELNVTGSGSAPAAVLPQIDAAKRSLYNAVRMGLGDQGSSAYRVNNTFLNVRAGTDVGSALVTRLNQGDAVTVVEIPNGEWAKVKVGSQEGYVALRYLAKVTTEQKLAEEKKQFEGKYYVDYKFLNVRKDPTSQAEKIAELPGQSIVKPLSINGQWARVSVDGKEGYVSAQYLKPLAPAFLVRQDEYTVPILQYRATDPGIVAILEKHIAALKASGKTIVTLKKLYDTVVAQESRDVRFPPDTVVLTISGVGAANARQVTDALQANGAVATLFVPTKELGISGITEKMLLNMLANGNDVQSEAHTGDDLRSLTDSQLKLELSQSKALIEQVTKKEVYAVSYPQGGVNDRVMNQAADLAYLFGLTQVPDAQFSRGQFLRLPTIFVSGTMSAQEVVTMVK